MNTKPALDRYLLHLAEDRGLATSTVEGYREDLTLMIRRSVPLEAEPIAAFVTRQQDGSFLAPATRNRRLAIVRGFCAYLVSQGVLPANPTDGLRRVRVPRSVESAFHPDDLRLVLAKIRRELGPLRRARDEAILLILFYTGLRVSELVRLDVGQVDLRSGMLWTAVRKGGGATDVILHPAARIALEAWLALRPASPASLALFPSGNTGRLSVRMIQKRLRSLGRAAGLGTTLHPHALRHAHATALLRAGVSTELIRQSMNHTSLATTSRYLHGDVDLLHQALGRLPDIGGGK